MIGQQDTVGPCTSCDKEEKLYDVGAYDGTSRFCQWCIQKFGKQTLFAAANAALAVSTMPKARKECLRCSAPLIAGVSSPMCSACQEVYRERFGARIKWL